MEPTMSSPRSLPLSHFQSYDDQDLLDLAYGQQQPPCQALAQTDHTFQDHSITHEWTPEED
jgi:hypothetical protein